MKEICIDSIFINNNFLLLEYIAFKNIHNLGHYFFTPRSFVEFTLGIYIYIVNL